MVASEEKNCDAPNADGEINDETVREYLKNHDDFLQRYPDMLDFLHVSHASGSAVSLVEKQVSVMRERSMELRQRLTALSANAKDNDAIFEQTRALVLKLLDATSVEELYSAFIISMATDFNVEYASMILYADNDSSEGYRTASHERIKKEIGALFRGHKPFCGTLRTEELLFLFPEGEGVGSAAIMPLGSSEQLGLIAVGSSDPSRYDSKTGTLFLAHISEVLVKLIPSLSHTKP
jgi:hypothetical protein